MNDTRHHHNQNLFSKWLLLAVLLLSFFTFGVPTGRSEIKPDAQRTTLLIGNSKRFVKSILFNNTKRHLYNKGVTSSFLVASSVNSILLRSRQINTRLKNHSGPKITGIQNGFFYRAKTISPNTSDDPVYSLG